MIENVDPCKCQVYRDQRRKTKGDRDEQSTPNHHGCRFPAPSDEYSLTVGPNGPVLLQDHYLIQKLAHFNRERVPERVVHAKGGGAYGYFEVTEDVTEWTKAALLPEVGKRTPMLPASPRWPASSASADTVRDPRGFAMKFYTEEGNYDLVGNNTPVFFIRDPMKFPDFIHSQKRARHRPARQQHAVGLLDALAGVRPPGHLADERPRHPAHLRHMNGYGSHTYLWNNAAGEGFWVKYHFKTDQGIKNFTDAEADAHRAARTPTTTSATCATRSSAATTRPGRSRSRSCRSRTRPTTASTRST